MRVVLSAGLAAFRINPLFAANLSILASWFTGQNKPGPVTLLVASWHLKVFSKHLVKGWVDLVKKKKKMVKSKDLSRFSKLADAEIPC